MIAISLNTGLLQRSCVALKFANSLVNSTGKIPIMGQLAETF